MKNKHRHQQFLAENSPFSYRYIEDYKNNHVGKS